VIDLEAAFLRLDADLRALRLQWALVGGFAVSLRSEPRTTRDIDLAIVVTGDQEQGLVVSLPKSRPWRRITKDTVLSRTSVAPASPDPHPLAPFALT
jgi:Nucleotidyl transferase AbiEii toxin, Type IV TA system